MYDRKLAGQLVCWVTALAAGACAVSHAPPGWLPRPHEARHEAWGGWASVDYCVTLPLVTECHETMGELIAVGADTIFVLAGGVLLSIPTAGIGELTVTGYDANTGTVVASGVGGILLSASHGFVAIFSAPIWLLSTIFAASAQSHLPEEKHPPASLELIRIYARFPQGLPEGIARDALRPKPPPGEGDRQSS